MSEHSVTVRDTPFGWWAVCKCHWQSNSPTEDDAVKSSWAHGDPVPVVLLDEDA